MSALIELKGITKTFGQGQAAFQALRGVDLRVDEGDFVAVMGPSGSGKSTAMNIIGCLDVPTSGEYLFRDVHVEQLDRNQRALLRRHFLGFVFQGFNLLSRTTAKENVELPLEIIGVLKAKGQSGMGRDQDDSVVMPIKAVQRRLEGSLDVSSIQVSVQNEDDIDRVQAEITTVLRERRHLDETEDDNFNVLDTRQIAETLSGTTQVLTMLLGAVASVSLLVGGIGIMNIMLVSVTERTREIGIRLAIGALEREVLMQFLIEAVALAALGGIIGIVLATGASILLSEVMSVPYVFDTTINLLSFVFSAGIGILFGYMPAKRAARLDPIEALRHE